MSTVVNKTALREAVLPLLNRGVSEETILHLIGTVKAVTNPNATDSLSVTQVRNVFKSIETCDVACGFGPGHQSTVVCTIRGPHDEHHYNSSQRLEWDESRLADQTYEYRGKTYRLAFSDEGWY